MWHVCVFRISVYNQIRRASCMHAYASWADSTLVAPSSTSPASRSVASCQVATTQATQAAPRPFRWPVCADLAFVPRIFSCRRWPSAYRTASQLFQALTTASILGSLRPSCLSEDSPFSESLFVPGCRRCKQIVVSWVFNKKWSWA